MAQSSEVYDALSIRHGTLTREYQALVAQRGGIEARMQELDRLIKSLGAARDALQGADKVIAEIESRA